MQNYKKHIYNYLSARIPILLVTFAILYCIAHSNSFNLFSDILSQFELQYLIINVFFVITTLYIFFYNRKNLVLFLISLTLTTINITFIKPYYFHKTELSSNTQIKIGLFNVLTSNSNYSGLTKEIMINQPDIVILQETDDIWIKNIKNIKKEYPISIEYPRDDNFGLSIYSKLPLYNTRIEQWTSWNVPVIITNFNLNNHKTTLIAIHTLPPINDEYIEIRNQMLQALNSIIKRDKTNLIIAGDLNTTIHSKAYKSYLPIKIIHDCQSQNNIFKGSWNTKHPMPLRISIDHILITPDLTSSDFTFGKYFGSDHFPIFTKIGHRKK